MSTTHRVYGRIARRETHSPRSTLAIVLAVVLILAAAYAITEIILRLFGQPPLLVAPDAAASATVGAATLPAASLIVSGIILAGIGVILILVSLSSGRRARHVIRTDRVVTVVDNEVIASALARHASYAGNTDPDNTRVSVSHRRAEIELTPTSGTRTDRSAVLDAVTEQLNAYELTPTLRAKVDVGTRGRVGA